MKNQIRVGLFVVSIFIFQVTTTYATDYNYLPNDVFLKQQEEKSALEYRLKTLETQSQSNPQASILSIEQRISQLRTEWATEKEYVTQRLAQLGALNTSGESPVTLKRIDDKYQSQIDSLNQQKSSYQSQSSSQQNSQEISDLKLEIAKLKADIVDQELKRNLDALKKYQAQETSKIDTYSDADVLVVFNYLDALSVQDASNLYKVIVKNNKDVADRIDILYNKKYPNGKNGTSKYDDYSKQQEVVKPEIKKEVIISKIVKPIVKQEIKKTQIKATTTEEKVTPQIKQEQLKQQPEESKEQKPVEVKVTFREKISGFFKKVFWR